VKKKIDEHIRKTWLPILEEFDAELSNQGMGK